MRSFDSHIIIVILCCVAGLAAQAFCGETRDATGEIDWWAYPQPDRGSISLPRDWTVVHLWSKSKKDTIVTRRPRFTQPLVYAQRRTAEGSFFISSFRHWVTDKKGQFVEFSNGDCAFRSIASAGSISRKGIELDMLIPHKGARLFGKWVYLWRGKCSSGAVLDMVHTRINGIIYSLSIQYPSHSPPKGTSVLHGIIMRWECSGALDDIEKPAPQPKRPPNIQPVQRSDSLITKQLPSQELTTVKWYRVTLSDGSVMELPDSLRSISEHTEPKQYSRGAFAIRVTKILRANTVGKTYTGQFFVLSLKTVKTDGTPYLTSEIKGKELVSALVDGIRQEEVGKAHSGADFSYQVRRSQSDRVIFLATYEKMHMVFWKKLTFEIANRFEFPVKRKTEPQPPPPNTATTHLPIQGKQALATSIPTEPIASKLPSPNQTEFEVNQPRPAESRNLVLMIVFLIGFLPSLVTRYAVVQKPSEPNAGSLLAGSVTVGDALLTAAIIYKWGPHCWLIYIPVFIASRWILLQGHVAGPVIQHNRYEEKCPSGLSETNGPGRQACKLVSEFLSSSIHYELTGYTFTELFAFVISEAEHAASNHSFDTTGITDLLFSSYIDHMQCCFSPGHKNTHSEMFEQRNIEYDVMLSSSEGTSEILERLSSNLKYASVHEGYCTNPDLLVYNADKPMEIEMALMAFYTEKLSPYIKNNYD